MINKVCEIITRDNAICFILNTSGETDYWYWEISRGTWNSYWKDKNPACLNGDIPEWAAAEFVNSDECSSCGCSCASYVTVEDAISDYLGGK